MWQRRPLCKPRAVFHSTVPRRRRVHQVLARPSGGEQTSQLAPVAAAGPPPTSAGRDGRWRRRRTFF